jgi:hypothetical protein
MPYLLAPLPSMLGIRPGSKVSLINPPKGFVQRLNPLPDGVEFVVTARTGLDVILFFPQDKLDLVQRLPALSRAMALTGGIWACWSKADPAGAQRGLSEDFIRLAALEIGLVDNKRCTLDESWSGLRLVWRPRGPRPEKPTQRHSPAQA